MPTTTSEFNYAQSWIGGVEEQAVFDERLDRLLPDFTERQEAIDAAIEESIRAQLQNMLVSPSSMSVGNLSVSYSANIQALQKSLEDFTAVKGTRKMGVTFLQRTQTR